MGAALLCAIAFVVFLPFLLLLLRENKGPIQFSVRTLLVAVTLVALILGGIGWWRIVNLAQLRWLDPASPEAESLTPSVTVSQNDDGEWAAVYCAWCRSIHDLTKKLDADGVTLGGDHTIGWYDHRARLLLAAADRELLEAYLEALRKADKLGPRQMVIRGRVIDADGSPVADASIDLMGSYHYINHFRTREDGTFTMPITPDEGWGYYLRIRPRDREPETTGRFPLSYDEPERVVIVRLP